jgi:signal transduction histidine kinase
MHLAQPLRWFQQLRWRLSLLYIALTVVLIFVGLGIGEIIGYYNYQSIHQPRVLANAVAENAQQLAPYISTSQVNTDALTLWLKTKNDQLMDVSGTRRGSARLGLAFYGNPSIYTAVTDSKGVVLVDRPEESLSEGAAVTELLSPPQAALLKSALQGETDATHLSLEGVDGVLVAAAPIFDNERQVVGALFVRLYAPFQWQVHLSKVASGVVRPVLILIALAAIGGIGFGLVTARHFFKRLQVISTAADAWARGDFSAVADDSEVDELGQLARRLNLMAKELQVVLALRQELATLEERNRLARDLHDTVKQQIFALAMQLGAAEAILNGASPEVHQRLSEAEKLARQVQHELVEIIRELQPTDRTGKDLEQLLQEHVTDWSRQSGVATEVKFDGPLSLPSPIDRAFFRIAQEALANVARHSHATKALVQVSRADGLVVLSITDNGVGFDPGKTNGGMGLRNMRERAEALPGGWFKVEKRGKGVRVIAGCDATIASQE